MGRLALAMGAFVVALVVTFALINVWLPQTRWIGPSLQDELEKRAAALKGDKPALATRYQPGAAAAAVALGASDVAQAFAAIALVVAGAFFYLLPAIVASSRGHMSAGAIIALNLLLGWTALGWVVAFVWALTGNTRANFRLGAGAPARTPTEP